MYKLKNILFAGFLSICVAVASMPIELLAQEAVQEEIMQGQEEDGTQEHNLYEIVSFEELTKGVNNRKVPVGTALEELELPETLTVSYRLHMEKPDDEGKTDKDPEDNTGDKGNESESGNDTGDKGNESEPGDDSGDKGNESESGSNTGDKGNENESGDDSGDKGNESEPGSDTGDKGNETEPGSDSGDKGNESESGSDTGGEGSESEPGGNAGDEGHESDFVDDLTDEAVVVQSVEVHMKEYRSKPEMAVSFGTLTADGQTADADTNVTTDQEAGGESADDGSDLNSDSESKQDAGTETDPGTEATPGTETAPGTEAGAESGAGAGTETNPGAETDTGMETNPGTDTGTDPGTETNPGTEAGTGTETSPGTEAGTETNPGTEAGTDTDPEPETAPGTEKDTGTDTGAETKPNTDPNKDTEPSPDEDNDISQGIETAVIENITWLSAPEYDGNTEGCYIFTPVLPEEYILADGVALPEIAVTVIEVLEPLNATVATPGGGTISEDTVWGTGTLSDCELIVEPGVTLTINGVINISGNVTIKGGGTIKRGSNGARFSVGSGADFTVGEITLEGASVSSPISMIVTNSSKLTLDDGCIAQNIVKSGEVGGAVVEANYGEVIFNDIIAQNCTSGARGGVISLNCSTMTVNDGLYQNNKAIGVHAGSVIYSMMSKLYIYGGKFINNTAEGSIFSGCIFDIASTQNGYTNETHIYGGYFEGNKKASQGFGGGAIFFAASSKYGSNAADAIFEISGDVRFCGDGVEGSGMDGFFLDTDIYSRKVSVGSPIIAPVYIHLIASENYVIAKGSNGYILTEKDMKQIRFTDEGNSGKKWYAWLDREKNEIYLSEKVPPYGLYVYYSSNGAKGRVEDNTEYESGADVIVMSAKDLSMEGYTFKEWNTKPDGTGTPYSPGDSFKITDDITLYAIFRQGESINASFYSGRAGSRDIKSEVLGGDADSVTIKAPDLKDMGDWTKIGWDEKTDSYAGAIAPGTPLTIAEDTSYYGVYEREVTLSYNANGGKEADTPGSEKGDCRANVHEEITYDMAGFKVAGDIASGNSEWEFVGWNTRQDGTGELYSENDTIKIAEDTTLYATFVRLPYAAFYSGNAGEFEMRKTNVVTGNITVPDLKEKSGWKGIGWDGEEDAAGFEGSIEPGAKLVLEENREYFGVYEKTATLSYTLSHAALGGEQEVVKLPAARTEKRRARAGKSGILYEPGPDDPDAFTFEVAPDPYLEGYVFMGWNTSPDGEGDYYREDDAERNKITITEDTVLYAVFGVPPFATFYSGSAGSYVIVPSAIFGSYATGALRAPELKEMEGWEPVGWSRSGTGYSESVELESGADFSITEDTFYYGIYEKKVELSYDGNGWLDPPPGMQSMSRYANVHSEITCTPAEFVVGQEISRDGYTFLGWSLERDAVSVCYRPGDTITLEESATIYAQMVDDIAPVLGEATYNSGYRDVRDWIVRKKDLVITVPITEKGSGVNKIVYTLAPESGEAVTGEALMEDAGGPGQARQQAAVRLEAGNTVNTGGEVGMADGQVQAKITVSEDYKGTVSLMCRDNAGNESPLKLLTAQGGGVIVEDNAPLISFRHKGTRNGRAVVGVTVYDNADENSNSHITGGIASVSYRTDNKQEQGVTDKGFAEGIVETCTFEVAVSGAGSHTIQVTAVDNAGNESSRSTRVRIAGNSTITTVIKADAPPGESSGIEPPAEVRGPEVPMQKEAREPELPMQKEPKTGDSLPDVAVYATLAMISGLLYVLLYFTTEQGGMTESDKDEAVARLVAWAKEGGRLRRCMALVLISCVLIYYHSIGKNITYKYEMSLIYMTHM